MTVATDEIYEKYLHKAISEINDLGDELAEVRATLKNRDTEAKSAK